MLDKPYQPSPEQISLIPKHRRLYLNEIVTTIHEYKTESDRQVQTLSECEALESTSQNKALSDNTRNEIHEALTQKKKNISKESTKLLDNLMQTKKAYEQQTFSYQVRNKEIHRALRIKTLSHQSISKIAIPKYLSKAEWLRFGLLENFPGNFPYTAGVFPLKNENESPKRMFAGEGTPERTNKRFHVLCQHETAKRISTAFDSVTLYGENPDRRPDIYGKIGESGVSVCSLDDMKKLYAGFDLCESNTSVSMTINGPAPMMLAFFFNTAIDFEIEKITKQSGHSLSEDEKEKIAKHALEQVRGTVQADILKEDQAQNTCIFSTHFALRAMGDIQQYFIANNIKNYYSVSISGYHIAEAGANPITQLAFTLANGFTYIEYYLARGMQIDQFASNFSFFFSNGLEAEYTVIGRVARRIWAIAMKYLYGANDRSQKLKYHIQTSGRSLHARESSFNDIRTTLQALIAYFDYCNSLHTNAYDEATTTPTEESLRRAMAIQSIIQEEFGWAKNENPLQGSFFIEELTELVEEAVLSEFERLSLRDGVIGAMETYYQRSKIQEESLYYEKLKHSGELPIIGVNAFLNPNDIQTEVPPSQLTRATREEKEKQIENLKKFHDKHQKESSQKLSDLKEGIKQGKNIFDLLMQASKVCSLGQMTHALYQVGGGQYRRMM